MVFASNPNLPEKAAGLAVVDERIGKGPEEKLQALGITVLRLKPHRALYAAVSSHPDMLLHHIGGEVIVYAPGTDTDLLSTLDSYGFNLVMGESFLSSSYPADIAYNAARVGRCYFHNLKHTDPVLKKLLESRDIEPVHVAQGYAKCSILPVGNESIITSDAGIARAAEKNGYDVLLVDFERSIRLPGLSYGFIGGTAGMIGNSLCALNGSLRGLSYYEAITSFFSEKKIEVAELSDGQVTDIGSILPLMTR